MKRLTATIALSLIALPLIGCRQHELTVASPKSIS
jgi:hypothetical protein